MSYSFLMKWNSIDNTSKKWFITILKYFCFTWYLYIFCISEKSLDFIVPVEVSRLYMIHILETVWFYPFLLKSVHCFIWLTVILNFKCSIAQKLDCNPIIFLLSFLILCSSIFIDFSQMIDLLIRSLTVNIIFKLCHMYWWWPKENKRVEEKGYLLV